MLDFDKITEHQDKDYAQLKDQADHCLRCGLAPTRTQVVFGTGQLPCKLMIIGEGPGEKEDLQGKPFVGRAGQLLTKILESVGIEREKEVYITNIVKCRPPQNRVPQKDEISACQDFLIRQIQIIQPKILLLLGAPALKTVLNETKTISQVRGSWYKIPVKYMAEPLYIMPLFHPSFLLRHENKEKGSPKWLTWQDMREVKAAKDFYEET